MRNIKARAISADSLFRDIQHQDTFIDTFMEKIYFEPNCGCWLWGGSTNYDGYGRVTINRRVRSAHRVAYAVFKGPVPSNLEVDHRCFTRCCVNPDHLTLATRSENMLRVVDAGRYVNVHMQKTHCKQGHPLSGDNLFIRRNGRRACRECIRRWSRKHYWLKRGKSLG